MSCGNLISTVYGWKCEKCDFEGRSTNDVWDEQKKCDSEGSRIHEEIKKEVERVGYNLIAMKPTENENIKSVFAISDKVGEYVTWIYNVSRNGLYHGHYFTYYNNPEKKEQMFLSAFEDYNNRN